MITHGGMSEIVFYKKRLKDLGLSEEYYLSLPYECQRAIMMAGRESANSKNMTELRKKIALRQYDFEEKVKEKVLTLFKKNR